jgi:pilus assembly protein CpaE
MSRFIAVTADSSFSQRAQEAAKGLHGNIQVLPANYLPPSPEDILRAVSAEPAEVVLLGPGLPSEDAIRMASLFDLQFPEISIVLVTEADDGIALPAMRAGIRDLLPPEATEQRTFSKMLERASLAAASRRRGSGSVTVAGRQDPVVRIVSR